MDCAEIRRTLSACLDGELERGQSKAVLDHLRSCPECTTARDSLKNVNLVLKSWKSPEGLVGFTDETLKAAREPYKPRFKKRRRRMALKLLPLWGILLACALWAVLPTRSNVDFGARLGEIDLVKNVCNLGLSVQNEDDLVDLADAVNVQTASRISRLELSESPARAHVALCGLLTSARTAQDARLFCLFLSDRKPAGKRSSAPAGAAKDAESSPAQTDPLIEAARMEYDGHIEAARVLYEGLIASARTPKVRVRLVRTYLALGMDEQAAQMLESAQEAPPDAALPGEIRLEVKRALTQIAFARTEPAYGLRRIQAFLGAGDYREAAEDLDHFWPGETDRGFLFGWVLARAGRVEQAIDVLDSMIDKAPAGDPLRPVALFETAVQRQRIGLYREAVRFFGLAERAAREVQDELFAAVCGIETVYALQAEGAPDEARQAARKIRNPAAREVALRLVEP